jgi:Ser/Thr protein kinase RdoA (MazF antagonist)
MLDTETLIRLIERSYATTVRQLHILASGAKQVYRLQQASGSDWVVRVYPPSTEGVPFNPAAIQAKLLLHLAAHAYPAERVIPAADGAPVVMVAEHVILVTTYLGASLQGWQPETGRAGSNTTPATDAPATFAALGALLGRLHCLPLPADGAIGPAGMLPRRELTWVAGELASVAGQVPAAFQAEYEQLTLAVQQANHCDTEPQTLIHNDCNLGNVVVMPDQTLALVDWDVAGLGPAVLDIGILLRNCFDKQQLGIQPELILAVVDGYCQYRRLTPLELARLPDAIAFMTLVLLAAFFPTRCTGELSDTALVYGAPYAAWQAQYAATPTIAALASERFATYR